MSFALRDRVALVTGASRGIGAAIARSLARRGARLALVARTAADLDRLAAELGAAGGTAVAVTADLAGLARAPGGAAALVAEVEARLGPVDVLVNNAGAGVYAPVADLDEAALRDVLELNVLAPHALARAVLPGMRARRRGVVCMVSSVLGRRALPMMGGYCASKAALEALAASLRAEVADDGVDVVVVRPGRTDTEFRRAAASPSGWRPPPALRAMSAERVGEVVARAIAARRHAVSLTGAGRALVALERLSPRLTDGLMRRLHRRMSPGARPARGT